jgi:hypothetical protein
MVEPTVESIAQFLTRYAGFIDAINESRVRNFKSDFNKLKTAVFHIRRLSEVYQKEFARNFNIFRILRLSHYEVRTHSAFLADLLDPNGTHGQGDLFLYHFFQTCRSDHEDFPVPVNRAEYRSFFVETEKATAHGNLDIVVDSPSIFLLTLENKIYAAEQDCQLKRYSDWISQYGHSYSQKALIYLTLDGSASCTAEGCRYYPISYRKHIKGWLETALAEVSAARLRETIYQYIEIITEL